METINYLRQMSHLSDYLGVMHFPINPSGVDVFMPFIEKIASEGAVVVFKVDGIRNRVNDSGRYTAVVSGGGLGQDYFRTDADTLEEALAYIVVNYARACWGFNQ